MSNTGSSSGFLPRYWKFESAYYIIAICCGQLQLQFHQLITSDQLQELRLRTYFLWSLMRTTPRDSLCLFTHYQFSLFFTIGFPTSIVCIDGAKLSFVTLCNVLIIVANIKTFIHNILYLFYNLNTSYTCAYGTRSNYCLMLTRS